MTAAKRKPSGSFWLAMIFSTATRSVATVSYTHLDVYKRQVRAKLRLMVKRILRKYKYPPDLQDAAVELVLQQAQALGESWV